MSKFKKSIFIIQYRISQRISWNVRTVLVCFYSSNRQNVTQRSFLPSKIEIVSMYFLKKSKNKWGRKVVKVLEQQISIQNLLVNKKNVIDMEMCADC